MARANEAVSRYTGLYDTEYLSKPLHQTELIIILNFEL